jgi:hypothetical protein
MSDKIYTFARPAGGITSVALSENGQRVHTGPVDATAILWDAQTKRLRSPGKMALTPPRPCIVRNELVQERAFVHGVPRYGKEPLPWATYLPGVKVL